MVKQIFLRCLLVGLLFMFAGIVKASPVDELLRQANDPTLGDPNGTVTVVEFFDYQCSHCANMAPIMARIIQANPDVRFVFKDYPVLGDVSRLAAQAAIASSYQDKYEEFTQALFAIPIDSRDSILEAAKSAGLNIKKLQRDMQSKKISRQIQNNMSLAKQLGVEGTPTFFIAKTNATSKDELNSILGEATETELQAAITKASSSGANKRSP